MAPLTLKAPANVPGSDPFRPLSLPKTPVMLGGTPNITGELGYMRDDVDVYQFASGAFSIASGGSGYTGENRVAGIKWTFSANRSNSAYAASDTVQPSSLRGLPCIKF